MKKLLLILLAILVIAPVQSAPLFYGNITYQKLEPYFKKCQTVCRINGQPAGNDINQHAEYKIDRSNYYIEALVPNKMKNRLFKSLDSTMFIKHVYMREVPVNIQNKYALTYILNNYSTPATLTIHRDGYEDVIVDGWWCKTLDTNGTGVIEWFHYYNAILSWKVLY